MEKQEIQHIVGKKYVARFATSTALIAVYVFIVLEFLFGSLSGGTLFWMIGAIIVGCLVSYCVGRYSKPMQVRYLHQRRDALRALIDFFPTKENWSVIRDGCTGVIHKEEIPLNGLEKCLRTQSRNGSIVAEYLKQYWGALKTFSKKIGDKTLLRDYQTFSKEVWKLSNSLLVGDENLGKEKLESFTRDMNRLIDDFHKKNMKRAEGYKEEVRGISDLLRTQYGG